MDQTHTVNVYSYLITILMAARHTVKQSISNCLQTVQLLCDLVELLLASLCTGPNLSKVPSGGNGAVMCFPSVITPVDIALMVGYHHCVC